MDVCGVCGGNGKSCIGCSGEADGSVVDVCGVCGGDGACVGCDGVRHSSVHYDACGVCGGDNECVPDKPVSENAQSLWIVFGVDDIDRSGVDLSDPFSPDMGEPVFRDDFTIEDGSFWSDALAIMTKLKGTRRLVPSSADQLDNSEQERDVIAAFHDYVVNTKGLEWPPGPPTNVTLLLGQFFLSGSNLRNYRGYIGFDVEPLRVRWLRSRLVTTTSQAAASFDAVQDYEAWQDALDAAEDKYPRAHVPVQVCDLWVRAVTEVSAVKGVASSVALSASVALLCLVAATRNLRLSSLAAVTVLSEVLLMLALYKLMGWDLGAIEAISISILLGLSVDATFHIAEAYAQAGRVDKYAAAGSSMNDEEISLVAAEQAEQTEAEEEEEGEGSGDGSVADASTRSRTDRLREALSRLGPAVVDGAITTILSCSLLLGCQILVFAKFGLIVVVNTMASIIYATVVFGALLAWVGPQGDQGSISSIVQRLRACKR